MARAQGNHREFGINWSVAAVIMLCNITQNAMGQTPGGGYPYPIMLCNITQNAMGQTPGRGVPSQVQWGGYPARLGWGVPR